jgi:hypothetical protein
LTGGSSPAAFDPGDPYLYDANGQAASGMLRFKEDLMTASGVSWPAIALIIAMCSVGLPGCAGGQAAGSPTHTNTAPTVTKTRTLPVTTTTAAARRSASRHSVIAHKKKPPCQPQVGNNYVGMVFCYLKRAGARNQMIESDCGPLLAHQLRDPGHVCLRDIESYQRLLQGAESDLRLREIKKVPSNLQTSAMWLGRAVHDELHAARKAIEAIRAHDLLGFLKAWGLHADAGRELQIAGNLFWNH